MLDIIHNIPSIRLVVRAERFLPGELAYVLASRTAACAANQLFLHMIDMNLIEIMFEFFLNLCII